MTAPFPTAAAEAVRTPVWRLTIEGRDITRDISPMVLSVTYTDHATGESDEIELQLEDRDGRWRGEWLPTAGDRIELLLGYQGEPLLPCGRFQVDELEAAGPPDAMTIRALAAGIIPAFRTKRSSAYEGQTLRQVAEKVAGRHGLSVVGEVRDLKIGRVTQQQETDLSFLSRLAESFGYVFSVRDSTLVFYDVAALEAAGVTFTVRRNQVKEYRLQKKTKSSYAAVEVSYDHPESKAPVSRTVWAEGALRTGDVYKIQARVENAEQADARARSTLRWLARGAQQGSLVLEGDPRICSGTNGTLQGFGKFDGKYQVITSTHRMTRGAGYETELEIQAVG